MSDFWLYFELGWQHILDWKGYDHIMFVTALCGIYLLQDWKKVLILVTAFTVGHTITLALSVFDQITVNPAYIEFLIPVTILITALVNIANKNFSVKNTRPTYILALLFGLIHGLGFSNYLKSLLGRDTTIVGKLFAFNIGLEVGQVLIVILVLLISFVFIRIFKAKHREWNLFLSSAIFGISAVMAIERFVNLTQ